MEKDNINVSKKTNVWLIFALCIVALVIIMTGISAWGFISIIKNGGQDSKSMEVSNIGPSGLIYGENYSYSLTAPNGWVLDNKAGQAQDLQAVFYKKGESWKTATVTMYTNTITKKPNQTLDSIIEEDINDFKTNYPDIKVIDGPSIKTMDVSGAVAKVKYENNDTQGRYEAVAYIDSPNVVIFIVLNSKDKNLFESSLSAFNDLVSSYFYYTSNVKIKK